MDSRVLAQTSLVICRVNDHREIQTFHSILKYILLTVMAEVVEEGLTPTALTRHLDLLTIQELLRQWLERLQLLFLELFPKYV